MIDIVRTLDFKFFFFGANILHSLSSAYLYLTPYIVDHKSMLSPIVHAERFCSTITVKTTDCAAPTKLIHVASDN